jgi:hypothetical protein
LDSERQSLVYNHHHELIAASATISAVIICAQILLVHAMTRFYQMKTRAESLDADLDLLKVAFSEISRLSSEIAIESTPMNHHNQTSDSA